MSIFNFFKKKEITSSVETDNINIETILSIPIAERDINWRQRFLSSIVNSQLYVGLLESIKSSEGFEYTNLTTDPESDNAKQTTLTEFAIQNFKSGLGIVINGHKNEPDWAFSYGDIVDFILNKEFYSDKILRPFGGEYVIDKYVLKQQARVGQPSELFLPIEARTVIRKFLESFGLQPKICLILWIQTNELTLALNILPEMFDNPDKEVFQSFINFLAWYLPKHYKIVCLQEDESFELL